MDTTKGELSFVLHGINYGVAYEGIPLDKPLVPCVILWYEYDSVELDLSDVKETEVINSISVPSNVTSRSDTWDSITIAWDIVEEASFYQVEVDGNKILGASTVNGFTKRGLLPESEHNFRMRAVKDNKVSRWSDTVKGRTEKPPEFSKCVWKECPDYVDEEKIYSVVGSNSRIATFVSDGNMHCTIIGYAPLPFNEVTSWNIKIIKSNNNDGYGIYIGVAPFDINQNEGYNWKKCGWYFNCYESMLCSGPPHYYWKEYGPRKKEGKYIHNRDAIGVVMDTTKSELSFILGGVNYGVAFEEVPLDKPLVPCVILYHKSDSVELKILK